MSVLVKAFKVIFMTHKNGKGTNRDKPETCPLCGGSGRISAERDDTDICAFDSKKAVCSLCRGSGKIKRHQRIVPTQRRCRLKKIPLKKPRPSRGGRPSLGKNVLLQPGTPAASCSEDDTPATSQKETGPAQQPSHFDIDSSGNVSTGQENLPQELQQNDAVAKLDERSSVLAECTDLFYGRPKGPPKSEQDILALLRRAKALGVDPFFPLAPNDQREAALANIGAPSGVVIGPNGQLEFPLSDAATSSALNEPDPLDVVGTPDPAVPPINTDVEGNIGS